jgi:hypothetical protein
MDLAFDEIIIRPGLEPGCKQKKPAARGRRAGAISKLTLDPSDWANSDAAEPAGDIEPARLEAGKRRCMAGSNIFKAAFPGPRPLQR